MEYPPKAPYQPSQPAVRVERPKQSLEAWVIDLCTVRDCIDGLVSKEVKGYSTLFACPLCDRAQRDLAPYQSIPSAKKWMGKYETFTELEMFERKQNRREVVDGLRTNSAKAPDLDTDMVGDGPF